MVFELELTGTDGVKETLRYDNQRSLLTHANGERVSLEKTGFAYADNVEHAGSAAFSPERPARKSHTVKRLKIQLGLGCNYECSYCSQASQRTAGAVTNTRDAETFLQNISGWLEGAPDKIEFWGGEPLLYWKKLQVLVPALHCQYPDAVLSIITNGALLDDEKVDFLRLHKVRVTISHDGPGQHLRGPDPFDDPEWVGVVRRLHAVHGVHFNMVLSAANRSPAAAMEWIRSRLGVDVPCNVESIVNVYHEQQPISQAELAEIQKNLFTDMATGKLHDVGTLTYKVHNFYHTLAYGEPAEVRGQKCGMDRPDWLAVDLDGNVLTCQNVGAQGGHKIGEVGRFDDIALNTAWHHTQRDGCRDCPVLHFCYGGCMFLTGPLFDETCRNEYAANLAVLMAALYFLTGKVLTRIQGAVAPKRGFPVKVVAA